MSSKEVILNRLRGAATPIAQAPHAWQPWRGEDDNAIAARALSWHDHRQPRRDPHCPTGKPGP